MSTVVGLLIRVGLYGTAGTTGGGCIKDFVGLGGGTTTASAGVTGLLVGLQRTLKGNALLLLAVPGVETTGLGELIYVVGSFKSMAKDDVVLRVGEPVPGVIGDGITSGGTLFLGDVDELRGAGKELFPIIASRIGSNRGIGREQLG